MLESFFTKCSFEHFVVSVVKVAKSDRILFCFIIPDIHYYNCCKYGYKNSILVRFYSSEVLSSTLDAVVNYCKQYLWLMVCSVTVFPGP